MLRWCQVDSCCAAHELAPPAGVPVLSKLPHEKSPRAPPPSSLPVVGARLEVPYEFYTFQTSTVYAAGGLTQSQLLIEQKAQMHTVLKQFARDLLNGVWMDVLLNDGAILPAFVKMDSRMTVLSIRARDEVRTLPLSDVEKVCGSEELRNIETANQRYIEETCVTLVLRGQQFVTFRLDNAHASEYFASCLRVIRMAMTSSREDK
jgi:hypothetical protein